MVTRWVTWDTVVRWSRLGWCETGQFYVFSHATVTPASITGRREDDWEELEVKAVEVKLS